MKVEKEFKGRVVFQRSESSSIKCQCSACKKHKGEHVYSSYIDGDFRKEAFIRNLLRKFDNSFEDYEGQEIVMKVTIENKKEVSEE